MHTDLPYFHTHLLYSLLLIFDQVEGSYPNLLCLAWMNASPNPWASFPKYLLVATLSFLTWGKGNRMAHQCPKCVHVRDLWRGVKKLSELAVPCHHKVSAYLKPLGSSDDTELVGFWGVINQNSNS